MECLPFLACKYCFVEMRAISLKNKINHDRSLVCGTCGNFWDTVTVIQDSKLKEYVQIRLISPNSILKQCPYYKTCKNTSCPNAHNELELEIWKSQKMFDGSQQFAQMLNPSPKPTSMSYNSYQPVEPIFISPSNNMHSPIPAVSLPHHPSTPHSFHCHHPLSPSRSPTPPQLQSHSYNAIMQKEQCVIPHKQAQLIATKPPDTQHLQVLSKGYNMSHRFHAPKNSRFLSNQTNTEDPSERSDHDLYYDQVLKSFEYAPNKSQSDSILVHLISEMPLEVKIELNKCPELFEWAFFVASDSDDMEVLLGVVLETNHGNNFRICRGKYKDSLTEGYRPLATIPERRGTVLILKKAINKCCSLNIPIQFKVALGDFKANLIFDFSHRKIVKTFHLVVHRQYHDLKPSQDVQDRYEKYIEVQKRYSLLWDKDYEVKYFDHPYLKNEYLEVFTSKIPVNIDVMIKDEKYKNVFNEELTPKSYKRIFEMLLYFEEFECRNIFLSYDIKNHPVNRTVVCKELEKYEKGKGGVEYAPKGLFFIKLNMSASLFEGFHFLRPPNVALLKPKAQRNYVYYCPSVEQGHDYIWIAVSDQLVEECERYGGTADVRFKENSIDFHFSMMHQALQNLDPRIVFPCSRNKTNPSPINIDPKFWNKSNLTESQRRAIFAALDNSNQDVPTIISGPFGCGKTWTLANLSFLLASQSDSFRILVCCKNNLPANKYIDDLHFLSQQHGYNFEISGDAGLKLLYRLFSPLRRVIGPYSEISKNYATLNPQDFGIIPKEEHLHVCRIIVTTVFTCPFLVRMELPREFFTHIILDEAAQVSEPELCIPLSLAGFFTKIIIAGDELQVTPKLTSPISQKYGLEFSLLDRLSNHPIYKRYPYSESLIALKENYRSDPAIVHFLSKLYYNRSLLAMRLHRDVSHNAIKPMTFQGVIGKEEKIRDFPTYMNTMEAEEIVHIIQELSKFFRLKDFAVLSTYIGQIWLIREILRSVGLSSVNVVNFEGIQGEEYKVLIVDTVRTMSAVEYESADPLSLGLLEEPKMLNTVLGRAQDHVVVVGNPYTLCEIGKNKKAWQSYISECINSGSFYIGEEQLFQFNLIPNEIKLINRENAIPENNDFGNYHEKHRAKKEDSSLKQRALNLIEEREKYLKELLIFCQQLPDVRADLVEHFEREKMLFQNQIVEMKS